MCKKIIFKKNLSKPVKLGRFFNLVKNSKNNQYSFVLRKKDLFKYGLSPKKILEMPIQLNILTPLKGKIDTTKASVALVSVKRKD